MPAMSLTSASTGAGVWFLTDFFGFFGVFEWSDLSFNQLEKAQAAHFFYSDFLWISRSARPSCRQSAEARWAVIIVGFCWVD